MKLVLILFYYIFSKRRMAIMKMTKRISSLIAALLLVAVGNIYSIDPFPFTELPKDMQNEIMIVMANNEIRSLPGEPASLKIAADKIRELTVSNKALNDIINRPEFTLKLIKNFAQAFHCDDDVVAKALGTRGAQERLKLQGELEGGLLFERLFKIDKFEALCKRGVDLEFVLHGGTPLMTAVSEDVLSGVKALCNKGVNVNSINKKGLSALGMAIWEAGHSYSDDQNIAIIKELIDAGADPEVGVKKLEKSPEVVQVIIQAAIAKKHEQK